MNRDGKGKMSLQIESHHQSSSSAVGYASGGKVSPPPQQVPLLGLGATGKRPAGIGTENVKQEIVMAERGENSVVLRVTLLAAGFVVGPNGASIHQIEAVSGAKVYSFNRSEDREVERRPGSSTSRAPRPSFSTPSTSFATPSSSTRTWRRATTAG